MGLGGIVQWWVCLQEGINNPWIGKLGSSSCIFKGYFWGGKLCVWGCKESQHDVVMSWAMSSFKLPKNLKLGTSSSALKSVLKALPMSLGKSFASRTGFWDNSSLQIAVFLSSSVSSQVFQRLPFGFGQIREISAVHEVKACIKQQYCCLQLPGRRL